ncbi:TolC family protein [Sulfurimonas sp.]|uniref:TolC family protein n=1 Tax=Sulfurimonas sp. TaxID=2022749 RepID=UPI002B461C87|nr:TolC family protein [Sulfurimonas sp.]
MITSLFCTNTYSNSILYEEIKEIIEIDLKDQRTEISFNELFKRSLKYNFDIQQIENKKLTIKEDIDMVKLGYYPQINLDYNKYKSYKDFEGDTSAYRTTKATFSINSTLKVYDFDAKQTQIDILKQDSKISDLGICEAKIQSSLQLLDAYYSIQISRASIIVLKKLILEHKTRFDMKTKLYEQGLLGAIQLITDKATLLNAINALNTQDNIREYYTAILKIKTGYSLNSNIKLAPLTHHYNSEDKNYELNYIKSKIKDEKINKNKKEIKFYQYSAMPTVDVYFNNDFYNEYSEGYPKYTNKRDYRVGLNLKWSLNSIFKYESKKRRKLLEIKNEEILYNKVKQETSIELNRRFIEIKNYEVFKRVSDEKIYTFLDEIDKNTRMYNEGLEYKYKISDSKIKIYNEELDVIKRKFQNIFYKKYISIVLEKDNICTLL